MNEAPITTRKTTKRATPATKPSALSIAAAAVPEATAVPVVPQPRETKALALRRSLEDPSGASLASLMASTGWQAHTVRAALSGLRKKGWAVQRRTENGTTIYFIDREAPLPDGETDVARVGDASKPDEGVPTTSAVTSENGPAV